MGFVIISILLSGIHSINNMYNSGIAKTCLSFFATQSMLIEFSNQKFFSLTKPIMYIIFFFNAIEMDIREFNQRWLCAKFGKLTDTQHK